MTKGPPKIGLNKKSFLIYEQHHIILTTLFFSRMQYIIPLHNAHACVNWVKALKIATAKYWVKDYTSWAPGLISDKVIPFFSQ